MNLSASILSRFKTARLIAWLSAISYAICCFANTPEYTTKFKEQADSFLSRLPDGMQHIQTKAIRKAMAGDCRALDSIRMARNAEPSLPQGVRRTKVGDNLFLFRSERFKNDTLPLLIYIHGGGWTIGSVNSCTAYCAQMAANGVAVLAVDYRLAPENPFPAGLNDCISAVKTAREHLTAWKCNSIALGGDSAGGNLSIATALSCDPGLIDRLILFYPVTAAYADLSESWETYGTGYGLDSELMTAFNEAYTDDIFNPLVSPAHASDEILASLSPTLLVAADHDILKSQGRRFAERIRNLGVDVSYHLIPGSVHLFITVAGQSAAFSKAVELSLAFIRN